MKETGHVKITGIVNRMDLIKKLCAVQRIVFSKKFISFELRILFVKQIQRIINYLFRNKM